MTVGWFSGRYDDDNDASKSNTISDETWRGIQDRALKANRERSQISSKEGADGARRGAENFGSRWWN